MRFNQFLAMIGLWIKSIPKVVISPSLRRDEGDGYGEVEDKPVKLNDSPRPLYNKKACQAAKVMRQRLGIE